MNGVTREQIAQAREVGLLGYLQAHELEELVKVGTHEYKTSTHDSLRISENGKWNWCSRGFGGANALNYLVRVEGVDFISAVRRLCDFSPALLSSFEPEVHRGIPAERMERPQRTFAAPGPDTGNTEILRYLRGRGIQQSVLDHCVKQGLVYQTDRRGYKNCVFVGKNDAGKPQYACVRGCGGTFRGDVTGSQKRYGFCIPAKDPEAATVEVYEAPIDALSGASLRVLVGREWRTVTYLSLGGLTYQALEHFLAKHPKVKKLQLCLDADEPGRSFAARLKDMYSARGYAVLDIPPPKGKDYNEYLQMRVKALDTRGAER